MILFKLLDDEILNNEDIILLKKIVNKKNKYDKFLSHILLYYHYYLTEDTINMDIEEVKLLLLRKKIPNKCIKQLKLILSENHELNERLSYILDYNK